MDLVDSLDSIARGPEAATGKIDSCLLRPQKIRHRQW
jgi:hypothetical protein